MLTLVVVVVAITVGSTAIPPLTSIRVLLDHVLPVHLDTSQQADAIVWNIRLPRVIVASLAGATLGVAGTVLQGSLRNPLADSQLVGLSAAGSVGALFGYWLGYVTSGATAAIVGGAITGLVGALAVQALANRVGGGPSRFILLGIGGGLALGSLVAAMSIAIHDPRIPDVTFWFFGGLAATTWSHVGVLLIFVVVSIAGLVPFASRLDVMALGYDPARHVGVSVSRVLAIVLAVTGLGVGATVGAVGVVGFVGLVGGRIAATAVGPHHRLTIPAAAFAGSLFVVGADVVGRVGGRGFEVPVGLITAFAGGVYLAWIIAFRRVKA